MATMKAFLKHVFLLFSILVTLSSSIFAAPNQIKGKEKMTSPTIFEDIAEGVDVTLQRLEALEALIHAIEDVQNDDVDPLQNSTRLGDTSRLIRGGGHIGIDSNPPRTSGNPPIRPNVRPSLHQIPVPLYDEDLRASAWTKAIENRLHHGKIYGNYGASRYCGRRL